MLENWVPCVDQQVDGSREEELGMDGEGEWLEM